ncbi:MAG: hypothetical protein O3A46_10625 [Candidatus Poribacteria bacterium]|nr:hypothetical protein [Candidatus Poribacteria bacterium]
MATFIYAGLDGVLTRWLLEEGNKPLQAQIDGLMNLVIDGLTAAD